MKEKCQLCEKETNEEVKMFIGGCVGHAHVSCMKIIKKYFDLENKWKQNMKSIRRKK